MTNVAPIRLFLRLLLACAIFIGGCDRKTPSQSPASLSPTSSKVTQVSLATFSKAIANAPFYVARVLKYFEQEPALAGVKLDFREYNDRAAISDAFTAGELQVLFSAEIPVILLRAQGNDVRIVATSTAAAQEILVRNNAGIKGMTDLRGKKLAVLQGTSSHYGLMRALEGAALKPSDLTLMFMKPDDAKPAFESGAIQAWAVWPPWVEQQLLRGNSKVLPGGNARIVSVMTFASSFLNQHREQALAVYSAVQKAKKWIAEHPQDAQRIVSDQRSYLPYKLEEVAMAFPKYDWALQLSDDVVNDIQGKADFLAAEKMTRNNKRVDVRTDLVVRQLQ